MTEEILQAIAECRREKLSGALATIISTLGSTPCKAGTRMLVLGDGSIRGTIGGGCAEAEVKLKALTVLDRNQPYLAKVSLLAEDAANAGMVCGGTMEVFIQPI